MHIPSCRYARLPGTIATLVVDSAPVTAGPAAVENVIAASAPPGWRRWVVTRYIWTSMRLRGADGGMASYWANLRRMGWGRPQLFLYSRDDPIADATEVRCMPCCVAGEGEGSWGRDTTSSCCYRGQQLLRQLTIPTALLPVPTDRQAGGREAGAGAGRAGALLGAGEGVRAGGHKRGCSGGCARVPQAVSNSVLTESSVLGAA